MALAAAGLILAQPALADLDAADYAATAGAASASEGGRTARRIAAEQLAEAERERREAQLAAEQMAEKRALLDARPYGVRITEARCTRCHAADHYLMQRHTWIGWSLVTLRMKYLNGAMEISETERTEIVAHLASCLPMAEQDAGMEYLVVGASSSIPFASIWIAIALRRRTKRKKLGIVAGSKGEQG